jgi:hypothetical protein
MEPTTAWELLTDDRQMIVAYGPTGNEAAKRYVNAHRGTVVIGYRLIERTGIFAWNPKWPIIGPDGKEA